MNRRAQRVVRRGVARRGGNHGPRVKPPRGAGDPQRALRRQHRHLRLGVEGSHDKLYLIMDFNPLHEPGQGNQGLRACNGYRYEFHIAKGASLKERWSIASSSRTGSSRKRLRVRRILWAAATSCSGSSPAAPRP